MSESNEWYSLTPRFPNHEINVFGQIRNAKNFYILKPFADRYGYLRLSIGNTDNVYIHVLVAETFVDGYQPGYEVNHKDTNKENNFAGNLEWVTKSYNIRHAIANGLQDPMVGLRAAVEVNKRRVKLVEENLVFESIKDSAEYLGVYPQNVQRVLRGERSQIHGTHVVYV